LLTKIIDGQNKPGLMKDLLRTLAQRGRDVAKQTRGEVYDPERCIADHSFRALSVGRLLAIRAVQRNSQLAPIH
jgi:hypothetical protein